MAAPFASKLVGAAASLVASIKATADAALPAAALTSAAINAAGGDPTARYLLQSDAQSAFYAIKRGLQDNNSNLAVLMVGDSTVTRSGGSSTPDGGYTTQFWRQIAARFPAYTVILQSGYNPATGGFGTTETLQTGTGPYTLYLKNVAVGGTIPAHSLGNPAFKSAYYGVNAPTTDVSQVDLIMFSYGYNGTQTAQMLATLDAIHSWHSRTAGIVIIEQWPQRNNNNSVGVPINARALAQIKNATVVPTERILFAAGRPDSWYNTLNAGEVHLSALGYSYIAAYMVNMWDAAQEMRWPTPPSIDIPGYDFLTNGRFDTYSGGTATGWTATNCTLGEDTTNFLTGSRSLTLTITTNADAYIEQTISNAGLLRRLSRRAVTLSGDIIYPSAQPSTSGRLALRRSGADVAISDRPFSSVSSLYDQAGFDTFVKKATTLNLPDLDGTVPLTIRFYAQLGVDSGRSGVGKVLKIDNIRLDIGSRVFGHPFNA